MTAIAHQYIERETLRIETEKIFADKTINTLFSTSLEYYPALFRILTSARISTILGFLNYDFSPGKWITGVHNFMQASGEDLSECVEDPLNFKSARQFFERKIRYWETRPMPPDEKVVVSPADSKVLVGSLDSSSHLFLKGKFFDYEELLGIQKLQWLHSFQNADFAVFRLTPEQYHYNHVPVTGKVLDIYEIEGRYHPCNPGMSRLIATPCSKNRRIVTIIDTNIEGGSQVGLIAMIEIVALMIGDIVQCYSERHYAAPSDVKPGMVLIKGQPKSLYRPGSSTDVILFQKNSVTFAEDIVSNMHRSGIQSRFSHNFGKPLVETKIKVRSLLARGL